MNALFLGLAPADEAAIGPARATLLGALALVGVNAAALASVPTASAKARLLLQLWDLGPHLCVGLLAAALVAGWGWVRRRAPWGAWLDWLALSLALALFGAWVIHPDTARFAERVAPPTWAPSLHWATTLGLSQVPWGLALLARLLGRGPLRAIGVGLGLACLVGNHLVLPRDYAGIHAALAVSGVVGVAGALATLRRPRGLAVLARALPWALLAAVLLPTVFVWPGNETTLSLLARSGSVVAPFAARARAGAQGEAAAIEVNSEWYRSREGLPAIPASTPTFLPKDALVLYLSVDALRTDVMAKHAARLPNLARFKREGVSFELARTPGAQTVYSLSATFAGTYFSQQYWTRKKGMPDLWPHEDPTARFPELLSKAGIPTFTRSAAYWLVNEVGIVRGFEDQGFVKTAAKYTACEDVGEALIARLKAHKAGPLFLFTHFLDSHHPYDRAGTSGTPFENYLGELALVDAELGRIRQAVEAAGLADRTWYIVGSDHGEAFGDHGATTHGTTLYEEQVRVPLYIAGPRVAARQVTTPVSYIDIGPTVLDMYGLPTPAHFMGQSLVGFLRGQTPKLTRPILVEGRLKKVLYLGSLKVIADDRAGTVELYDLKRDPKEKRNLFGGGKSAEALGHLRAFFKAHRLRKAGYEPPYRG